MSHTPRYRIVPVTTVAAAATADASAVLINTALPGTAAAALRRSPDGTIFACGSTLGGAAARNLVMITSENGPAGTKVAAGISQP